MISKAKTKILVVFQFEHMFDNCVLGWKDDSFLHFLVSIFFL